MFFFFFFSLSTVGGNMNTDWIFDDIKKVSLFEGEALKGKLLSLRYIH